MDDVLPSSMWGVLFVIYLGSSVLTGVSTVDSLGVCGTTGVTIMGFSETNTGAANTSTVRINVAVFPSISVTVYTI